MFTNENLTLRFSIFELRINLFLNIYAEGIFGAVFTALLFLGTSFCLP